jgi:hypothetical protein
LQAVELELKMEQHQTVVVEQVGMQEQTLLVILVAVVVDLETVVAEETLLMEDLE